MRIVTIGPWMPTDYTAPLGIEKTRWLLFTNKMAVANVHLLDCKYYWNVRNILPNAMIDLEFNHYGWSVIIPAEDMQAAMDEADRHLLAMGYNVLDDKFLIML